MNDEKKPRVHPDVYEGLPEQDRRVVELLAAADFGDARVEERVKNRALASRQKPRTLLRPLVLVPVSLTFLIGVFLPPKRAPRSAPQRGNSPKAYVDLSSRYYSAEEVRAALSGS